MFSKLGRMEVEKYGYAENSTLLLAFRLADILRPITCKIGQTNFPHSLYVTVLYGMNVAEARCSLWIYLPNTKS